MGIGPEYFFHQIWNEVIHRIESVNTWVWLSIVLGIVMLISILCMLEYIKDHNDPNDYGPMW